jgi:hypothetical protein
VIRGRWKDVRFTFEILLKWSRVSRDRCSYRPPERGIQLGIDIDTYQTTTINKGSTQFLQRTR